jgi:hypothetical protein
MDSQSREAMYELMAKESEARLVIVIDHATDTRGLFSKVITATSNNGSTTYAG